MADEVQAQARVSTGRMLAALLCMLAFLFGCADETDDEATGSADGVASSPAVWFRDATEPSGLAFVHEAGTSGDHKMPEVMGAGVALFDADGDGDLDVYFTNGYRLFPPAAEADRPTNRLFLQVDAEEGDGGPHFVDATAGSGLADKGYGMGVAVGDVDNDGDLDVYVANFGADHLYLNAGGVFVDATQAALLDAPGWSSSVAFLDYDRDGWLDLFVVQYVHYDESKDCFDSAGRPEFCGPREFPPAHDLLLRNQGDGTFRNVSETAGISTLAAAGLGIVCEDFDGDGWTDICIANDAYTNHLWINQRDGTFRDDAMLQGVAYNSHGVAEAGMGIVAADFDGDGRSDVFMTHLSVESNTLYRNLGTRGFQDITSRTGLSRAGIAFTGFGTVALDLELDGDLDLLVGNGGVKRNESPFRHDVNPHWDEYAEPNLLFINDGTGGFTSSGAGHDPFCTTIEMTRGMAHGDVDRDGDVDLIVASCDGPARLYLNEAERHGGWLSVRAVEPDLGRDAIGAHIVALVGGRRLARTMSSAHGYLSSSPPAAHFGLGDHPATDGFDVRWPDGTSERFPGAEARQTLVLLRGDGEPLQ